MDSSSENTTSSPNNHDHSLENSAPADSGVSQSSLSPSASSIPSTDQTQPSASNTSSDQAYPSSNPNDSSLKGDGGMVSQNRSSQPAASSDPHHPVNPSKLSLSNESKHASNSSHEHKDSLNSLSSNQSHNSDSQPLSEEDNKKNIDSLVSQSEASNDTIQALKDQFIYYFSDCNIFRDSHFRDQILSDPNEWVPLSFFLTWHRVKNLTTNIADLVKACDQVSDFEIDASDSQNPLIRRLRPYPLTHKTAEKTCYLVLYLILNLFLGWYSV